MTVTLGPASPTNTYTFVYTLIDENLRTVGLSNTLINPVASVTAYPLGIIADGKPELDGRATFAVGRHDPHTRNPISRLYRSRRRNTTRPSIRKHKGRATRDLSNLTSYTPSKSSLNSPNTKISTIPPSHLFTPAFLLVPSNTNPAFATTRRLASLLENTPASNRNTWSAEKFSNTHRAKPDAASLMMPRPQYSSPSQ